MKEYLKREIKEKQTKLMKEFIRVLVVYVVIVVGGLTALLFSVMFGSLEWKKSVAEFWFKDWISHSGYMSNTVLVTIVTILGLAILYIPFYKRQKGIDKLKQQLKKLKTEEEVSE